MMLLLDEELPPGQILHLVGPGFYPPNEFVFDRALVASTQTFGAICANHLAAAYRPEGLP